MNPIEMAFSKLKAHLRHIEPQNFADVFDAIAQICDLSLPEECWKVSVRRHCSAAHSG
ncbi:hypothetical protein JQU17_22970 [Ponticoccus sp. SC2-23]|nr:hypothetical protein [Ponticoccus sp. SC6-9]MBM1227498.1 hypothetical protein [Ponticoccus sp. SC6-15]MBM1232016.1 hypothetical protein [Ponticoccus sp. SC6-38]MBM1236519.1 hypothetical protein [Ponticoccus sp. SC6-45]MBM1241027.1 hypothetical protein [Ponticoccus sp. SC6-49]MBM1245534.1 hypothetical protein [Ponticoccus sp. SC2-64]MBM1250024.1 hypothetical protein [Ponticoccus sp. SC6-42]MBM1254529.1 hypothetical protein [Ponticoccus sp. SC6-33]MBM1259035.1 hypothetical protein [Pontico